MQEISNTNQTKKGIIYSIDEEFIMKNLYEQETETYFDLLIDWIDMTTIFPKIFSCFSFLLLIKPPENLYFWFALTTLSLYIIGTLKKFSRTNTLDSFIGFLPYKIYLLYPLINIVLYIIIIIISIIMQLYFIIPIFFATKVIGFWLSLMINSSLIRKISKKYNISITISDVFILKNIYKYSNQKEKSFDYWINKYKETRI